MKDAGLSPPEPDPDPYESPQFDSDPKHTPRYKGDDIDTNLIRAVAVTLCLCWPLGVVALIYSAQVNARLLRGDIEGARLASRASKIWTFVAAIGGILALVVYALSRG